MVRVVMSVPWVPLVYLLGLHAWFGLYLALGDAWWWLFLLSTFAPYLYMLVPVGLIVTLLAWRIDLLLLSASGLMIAAYLFGPTVMATSASDVAGETVRVMTFNVLNDTRDPGDLVAALRASNADVTALQELNQQMAEGIARELSEEDPHMALAPASHGAGMGVLSRLPMEPTGETIGGQWIGRPQVLGLSLSEGFATLANLHAPSVPVQREDFVPGLQESIRRRDAGARAVVAFAAGTIGP